MHRTTLSRNVQNDQNSQAQEMEGEKYGVKIYANSRNDKLHSDPPRCHAQMEFVYPCRKTFNLRCALMPRDAVSWTRKTSHAKLSPLEEADVYSARRRRHSIIVYDWMRPYLTKVPLFPYFTDGDLILYTAKLALSPVSICFLSPRKFSDPVT